ncbi:uncharacterized protein LOC108676632 [Hyalella azteca]|uniref:Uncharacterized protein LOC108676632 n=1 Tax=Hyalella azteca TaxID=294128 RepID=A0A8B7P2J2_HYAAZ|nr:uncharacterized protein LOC108676632 [Hyalella azteca]
MAVGKIWFVLVLSMLSTHLAVATTVKLNEIGPCCSSHCSIGEYNNATKKCPQERHPNYTCNLENCQIAYDQLVIYYSSEEQKLYDTLHILNARTVKLYNSHIADKLEFTNVSLISTVNEGRSGFDSLILVNSFITNITFTELKFLKLNNSSADVVKLSNLSEMDILDESSIKELEATISSSKSTFSESLIESISKLSVIGTAKLNVINMKINSVGEIDIYENTIVNISSLMIPRVKVLLVKSQNVELDNVTIEEIPDGAVNIYGKLHIQNSVLSNVHGEGIVIQGSGKLVAKNVSFNGKLISFALEGMHTENSNISLGRLCLSSSYSAMTFWIVISVLILLIAIFGVMTAFLIWKKRSSAECEVQVESSMKSRKLSERGLANLYTPPAHKEEIPMGLPKSQTESDGVSDPKEDLPSPPPTSQTTMHQPRFPPPIPPPPQPPQEKQNSLVEDEYTDVENNVNPTVLKTPLPPHQSSLHQALTSALHKSNKIETPQVREPTVPAPNPKPSVLQKPVVPMFPIKPLASNPLLNPTQPRNHRNDEAFPPPPPLDSLPPSHHYIGRSKPLPPPRKGSGISLPPVDFVPVNQNDQSDLEPVYEDTAVEEPLYAEDEIET